MHSESLDNEGDWGRYCNLRNLLMSVLACLSVTDLTPDIITCQAYCRATQNKPFWPIKSLFSSPSLFIKDIYTMQAWIIAIITQLLMLSSQQE
ncbi:MAG: hypothetical protein RBR45_01920 [Pseudomonas sp.]|nr:hypothetical protein [Pseudomonas sp.]